MTKFKLGLVVAAMAVAACGGNNETKENNDNNGATNNGTTATNNNNGTTGTNNGGTTGTNNGGTTGTNNGGTTGNNTTGPTFEEPPGCDDTPAPARCTGDPATQEWQPTSVVDFFFLEGTEDDPVCCYDYGGPDSEIDNSLGTNLAAFDFLADINTSIEESIAGGSLVLLLEHNGITDLADSDPYEVNFFIGAHADETAFLADGFIAAGGNQVLIDPASFDLGTHPQAYLPDAQLAGGALSAGPGAVKIEIELFDSPLQLTISLARTDTVITQATSALDATGIALEQGQLGGVVKVEDIFVAVNEFATGACGCLGLDGADLVDVTTGMCSDQADAQACEDAGESTCSEVAGACQLFSAVSLFADVDLDGDGLMDSVSIGSSYTAVGAEITGVSQ